MNDNNTIETKTKKITDDDIKAAIGRAEDDWIPFDDEYGVERELVTGSASVLRRQRRPSAITIGAIHIPACAWSPMTTSTLPGNRRRRR